MRRIIILLLALFVGCGSTTPQECVSQEAVQKALDTSIADNVVIVLDDSGSMCERMRSDRDITKMDAAKQALITILKQLPKDTHVGVVLLNGTRQGGWLIPLGPVPDTIEAQIKSIRPNGGTPLGERIKEGADMLLKKREASHYGSYRLLIVTDGEANDPNLVDTYLPDILSRGLTVDVIGVDMSGEHSLATKVHNYRSADDPASLEAAIKETFAESSDDATGQEDYLLASVIPDEMAVKIISTLTSSGNHAIGEVPQVVLDEDGTVFIAPAVADEGMGSLAIALIVFAVGAGIIFFCYLLFQL